MKKSELEAVFINAKTVGERYIGVKIATEGSSQPEIIINPKENFDAKLDYYMSAYDDDLILISAKGKKISESRALHRGTRLRISNINSCRSELGGKSRFLMRSTKHTIK